MAVSGVLITTQLDSVCQESAGGTWEPTSEENQSRGTEEDRIWGILVNLH